jgi:ATP-binding cassette subfamily B protein
VFFVPPLIVARLVDIFVAEGRIGLDVVGGHIALFGGLWFLGEILWRIGEHSLIRLEARGIRNLYRTAFSRLVARDYAFYANNFVGSLTKKSLAFSRSFEGFTDIISLNIFPNLFPLIFAVVVLWRYSFWIPLVLVAGLTVAVAIVLPLIRRRSRLVALRHDASSALAGRLSDTVTNMMAIKSFAQEGSESGTYADYADDYAMKFKKAADYNNLRIYIMMSPLYVLINVLGLILAVFFVQRFGLQAGAIVVVFSYYSQVSRIFWEISHIYRTIESATSEAAEFTQLFLKPPRVLDVPNAGILQVKETDIRFKKVDFRYSDQKQEDSFLDDFELHIKSKQKVGLVGPSGGGKTTITKLLLRFLDVQSGEITIDGQDISKVTQASLRNAIAYVPQEPLLFHRSLFENIAYSNPDAPKKDVIRAAKLAHADEFIQQLPKGYVTPVGERGVKLSGGQRQRVAIARAILKHAPILVLDEATSSLDSESEKYIQEGLWELMKDKTALVIAHRLSTIKHLDRIIVLDQGKIVQDGTHDQLIRHKGLYAKLWSHQSGEFL